MRRTGALTKQGLKPEELPLVIAAAAEIGNNCFDHNLGNWHDLPGCWLETQVTGGRLWLCIADRGQGILRSLRRALPKLADDQQALTAAFEQRVSGRVPENRGNDLNFVKGIFVFGERGLACRSGRGLTDYGVLGRECSAAFARTAAPAIGTITLACWRL